MQQVTVLVLSLATLAVGQRPFFAGSRPIGYPEVTTEALADRFGEVDGTTQRLPIEANGDRNLVDRLSKLPIDKQPFWFINWQALEANRQKPQTYPQKPNVFVDPIQNNGGSNSPSSSGNTNFNSGSKTSSSNSRIPGSNLGSSISGSGNSSSPSFNSGNSNFNTGSLTRPGNSGIPSSNLGNSNSGFSSNSANVNSNSGNVNSNSDRLSSNSGTDNESDEESAEVSGLVNSNRFGVEEHPNNHDKLENAFTNTDSGSKPTVSGNISSGKKKSPSKEKPQQNYYYY